MNKFKKLKKALALVLVFCMVMGSIPATAFASTEKEPIDAAILFSDLHSMYKGDSTEGSKGYKKELVTNMMTTLKNTGLNFSSVTSVGDAFSSNETAYTGKTSIITGYIRAALGNTDIPVNYTWSDHDRAALAENDKDKIENKSGLIYGAGKDGVYGNADDGNYYIYAISHSDTSSAERYNQPSTFTDQKLDDLKNAVAQLDSTKPIFIASHQPLLARRSDNQHAYKWCTAINEIAQSRDVAFFFGHNHNYDKAGDYFYKKGQTMTVQNGNSTKSVKLNFTHVCTGYFDPATTGYAGSSRQGTVMVATIYEDSMQFTTYDKNGVYTGNEAVDKTVKRDFASTEKTVTDLDGMVSVTATSEGLTGITATNVVAEKNLESYFMDYVAYEVELEGYQEGKDVSYSMYLLEDMDDTNLELYLVADNGEMTPISYKKVTDEQGNEYIEFTVKGDGCFVYGAPNVPAGYTLSKLEVSNIVKDVYYLGESLDMVNPVVTATYTKEGYKDFERVVAIKSEGYDGYEISGFDMTKVGRQTVTITYGNLTTGFDITVKKKGAVDEKFGIHVEDVDNNITSVEITQDVKEVEGYTTYVVYDIVPEGYVQGTETTVTVPVNDTKFDFSRPVKVIDIERNTSESAFIKEGKVTFKTNHFSKYAIAQRAVGAPTTTEGLVATGANNTAVSSIQSGNYYLIQNNNHKGYLTGNLVNSNAMLELVKTTHNTPTVSANNFWYITEVDDGYTVQRGDASGKYLTFEAGKAGLSTDPVVISLERMSGYWDFGLKGQHLNNYGGTSNNQAAGYSSAANRDVGSRWNLYQVTTVPATLSVNESALGMYIGDAQNLTASVTVNNAAVTGSTITWESSDEEVVTVNDEGQVVAVGAGTAEITAILASVDTGRLLAPARVTIPVQVNALVEGTTIDITHKSTQQIVDKNLVVKNVEENSEYELDYKVLVDGRQPETKPTENIVWSSSDESIATVENGVVTFHGNEGIVRITVSYEYEEDTHATDSVVISVSKNNYMIPSDGTNDFPEYPNEGSVRFDKTATAVGNFSETGIAQLELSMTGIPSSSASRMDVVLMLDRSSSMYKEGVKHRISSTVEATKAFVKNIVINEDGSFNNNRIMVMDFLGGNVAQGNQHQYESNLYTTPEDNGYQVINNQAELDALFTKIQTDFVGQTSLYGTEYAKGLEDCYKALHGSKEDGNKQFCVFMSDGIPNYMMGENTHFKSTNAITGTFDVTNRTSANGTASRNATKYEYEKYSTQMKNEGVTVFSVGLGLKNTNSAWSGTSAAVCEQVANMLLNDISGPAGEKVTDRDTGNAVSKLDEYFFSVADDNAAAHMEDVFTNIAKKILEAAKNVKVTDKIADEYTMIFDIPKGPEQDFVKEHLPKGQEFYIEFLNYSLKPVVEQGVTTDYIRDKETSLMKLYLAKDKDGNYFAASDAKGTPFAAPTFEAVQEGQDGYYNLVNGTYVFTANGTGTHNMISGARVSGTTNDDLIIETPYVHYEAANRILVWTAEKLSSSELALRYFLYLNDSAAQDPDKQVDAGTYPTNDYATLEYTNFQGNDCQQIFPKPQMTWNGAQVSYVFYLVNEDGKPVNRAGRVVPFSEAVYVTDIFTYAVTWNRNDASAQLVEEYLAVDKVPDVYELYDKHAGYNIYVYETENGVDKNNHFDIIGSSKEANTTYVFNTKSDVDKYRNPGTYDKGDVHTGFDFSNTTVAFAVLWKPELAEDTVVVDYGLPVDIDVARNDAVAGAVTGIFDANNAAVLKDVKINKGQISNRVMFATELNPGEVNGLKYGKAEVLNNTTVRYTPKDMQMETADKFYYVSTLEYYEKDKNGNDVLVDSRMYSSVTVIPATTIYYEDTFVSYEHGYGATDESVAGTPGKWETVGTVNSKATQDEDRPGESQISADLDADNIYGYDNAYVDSKTYSLGSAHKVNLNKKPSGKEWPKATFTFTGTAFDVISQTSNTTGTIAVEVKNESGTVLHNWIVDTYYGYSAEKSGYKEHTFTFGDDGKWHLTKSEVSKNKGENGTKPAEPKVGDTVVVYEDNIVWTPEKPYLKNTYAYEDGEWKLTTEEVEEKVLADDESLAKPDTPQNGDKYVEFENNDNTLYQIPVIKSPEMAYGTYTVTITPRFSTGFNHTANDNYDFYLDAIRVYSPADDGVIEKADGTVDTTVNDAYKADGELYPEFIELRKELLDQNAFAINESRKEGAVFIDGLGINGNISDYSKYGPNNEIYLQKGQAVAFVLETENANAVNKEHLGIKVPNKGTNDVKAEVTVSALAAGGTVKASKQVATSSATELYFDVSECVNWTVAENNKGTSDIIVIENKGDAMVSLTNLKVTYNTVDASPALMMMNADAAAKAVSFVKAKYVDSVKTAEKARVASITTDKSAYVVNDTVKATVKTNDAAEYVTVNGKKITAYKESGSARIWTYTEKASKKGNMTFKAIAYNELEEASDAVSKKSNVKQFVPKTFKLALGKSKVVVGDAVKATVTTSSDVSYVKVNGTKVTNYTTNKSKSTRTWTLNVKASSEGKMTVKAVAYNKNGSESKAVSKNVTVNKFAPKAFKVTSNSTVKKGNKYTVSVSTSSDVSYVKVNGKKITKFTSNKAKTVRTFKVSYTAKTVGKATAKVVAYNKNGYASKAKTKTVTVKKK
ncbi:MAG: bacterial Ig-like domain-containing protein [Eubacterium sp.]|nr:bacterial Ig-like domain-containing protein [Eubacterium sp.]